MKLLNLLSTIHKYASLKKEYLRVNQSNFVIKELSKAIINRSRLRNEFLKNRSVESRMKYNKQRRNIFVVLLRKTKKKYYEDLRLTDVNYNKKFGKLSSCCLEIKSRAKVKWHLFRVTI